MPVVEESIKNFVRTYLDFNYSLFFIKSHLALRKHKKLFDSGVVKRPLTYRQRISVILDEKRNLVVAGAGTGKTTTILAKVLYLIKDKKCKANEILLLAFSKAAEKELNDRLKAKAILGVKITTMHALGLEVIKHVKGKNQIVTSTFSDKNDKLKVFISKIISELPVGHFLPQQLALYFSEYLVPFKPYEEFKDDNEYLSWRSSNALLTFNGDWVKSHGELVIGNYLYSNNIPHSYEEKYKFDENYRPDFYLDDTEIYIEYFGIDKNNNTAPWIDKIEYIKDMEWKRNTHSEKKTTLIEITYEDFKTGIWKKKLSEELRKCNIKISPKTPEEIIAISQTIKNGKSFTQLSSTISQFLTFFKSKSFSIDKLIKENKKDVRTLIFLQIFKVVFEAYEEELKKRNSIDFMDMLNMATRYIKEGKYLSKWKYIIIDEFQDTSFAQYELINHLLAQQGVAKMYCVGDDWQSIYAFSGADYHYMTDYKSYFGVANFWSRFTGLKQEATLITLDQTFRFNNMISHTSGTFIQKNPAQIRKTLKVTPDKTTNQMSVFVHWGSGKTEVDISLWLNKYASEKEYKKKNLLILSRYNYNFKSLKKEFTDYIIETWGKNGKVSFNTCHSSKGSEEDIVLIISMTSNFLAFPSNIVDDPVLNLVKTAKENEYLHAEERRLFYVAMTRAKHHTHILCDAIYPSVFALEIANKKYKTQVFHDHDNLIPCTQCGKGYVINKTKDDSKSPFYQCSRADICDFIGAACSCGGLIFRNKVEGTNKDIAKCSNKSCEIIHKACKGCKLGIMVKRQSKDNSFNTFMSCHRYPKCKYKENIKINNTKIALEPINSLIGADLIESYKSADYHVDASPSFILKIGEYCPELESIYKTSHKHTAAFITAFNPYSQELSNQENKDRSHKLEELIQSLHFDYIHGEGKCGHGDWDGEKSFLIFRISEKQACEIGKEFKQNAIVWCDKDAIPQLLLLK